MTSALALVERYHKDGEEFINQIVRVRGDETRVSFMNVKPVKEVDARTFTTKEEKV
jgi:hypothetical protein